MKTTFTFSIKAFFTSICLYLAPAMHAQAPPQLISDSLQAILDRSLPSNFAGAGCVMRVESPGQWVWEGATGSAIAGITSGQPQTLATPQHQFRVGSITKTMVATCILKLEQQGLLNINDAVNPYLRATLLNDTIMPSDTLRIRHLLNHTSGIANSADNNSCQMNVLQNPAGSHTLEEAIYCGASQGEIFSPGMIWAYSNTNYSILAMIIENVTGMPYEQYITQNLFVPLNLNNTLIPTTNQIQQAHMGCYWNIGSWIDLTVINPTTYTGWADVVSTNEDLLKFYQALLSGNIINSTELAIMKTIDPASFDYGMGLDFYVFSGTNYFGHYGEVANTSGMFFADINSQQAPNGYFISYNFNTQGADMQTNIDFPVLNLLKNTTVGLKDNILAKAKIFPNPAKETIMIEFGKLDLSSIIITDMQGRLVLETSVEQGTNHMSIDISELDNGVYCLSLKGSSGIQSQKLIKE